MKIAFQGEHGAFSEQAAIDYFGDKKIRCIPQKDFKSVFLAVASDKANAGIIPVENSTAGSIYQSYDLFLESKLFITGEIKLRVKHCLLAKPRSKLANIARVCSHPQALMQCSDILDKHEMEACAFYDTAGAAQWVASQPETDIAAIAGAHAATTYGLKIVKQGIENSDTNYTRFVIISKRAARRANPGQKMKTSVVFALNNAPGGLHKALSVFAIRDIDLVNLQSRPIPGSPWKYYFYLDFLGSKDDEAGSKAITHLNEITKLCRVFGSYPVSL